MPERCPDCGALLAMVGARHRCVPANPGKSRVAKPSLRKVRREIKAEEEKRAVIKQLDRMLSYKYRDPEKRRAYMRSLMRKRREGR